MNINQLETDEQRAEVLMAWLRENAAVIILGVALGLGGIFGWNYWRSSSVESQQVMADHYEALLTKISTADNETLKMTEAEATQQLDANYLAFFHAHLAAKWIEKKDFAAAEALFNQIINSKTQDDGLRHLAILRLAYLKMDQQQYEEAQKILASIKDSAFLGLAREAEGDIYVLQNNRDAAKKAYQEAAAFGNTTGLLSKKQLSLGETTKEAQDATKIISVE